MMVLSASSVNAYVTYGDSYYYVKRQVVFLVIGVVGAFVIMKLPSPTTCCGCSAGSGLGLATVLLILTYTPLGIEIDGNRNWLYLGFTVRDPAGRVRQAGHDHLGRGRAGPQGQAARPASAPADPVPAGLRDCLILLVVFQGDAGTAVVMARDRGRRAVDRRHPDAGARRPAGAARSAAWSPSSSPARSGCAAWRPSWTRPPTSTAPTTRPTPGMFAIASGGWWGVGARRQPAEVGRACPRRPLRLHLRRARRGVRAVRQPRRARPVRRARLRRAPDRHPLRRPVPPATPRPG